jgi:hypothetical protein
MGISPARPMLLTCRIFSASRYWRMVLTLRSQSQRVKPDEETWFQLAKVWLTTAARGVELGWLSRV